MADKRPSYYKRFAARVAQRDGGYFCRYCGVALVPPGGPASGVIGYEKEVYRGRTHWYIAEGFSFGTIDHVIPRAKGGTDDMSNLVLACSQCNSDKHVKPLDVWNEMRGAK